MNFRCLIRADGRAEGQTQETSDNSHEQNPRQQSVFVPVYTRVLVGIIHLLHLFHTQLKQQHTCIMLWHWQRFWCTTDFWGTTFSISFNNIHNFSNIYIKIYILYISYKWANNGDCITRWIRIIFISVASSGINWTTFLQGLPPNIRLIISWLEEA